MSKDGKKIDGRVLRSERSRQLIIDAMLALVEEGNLVPTAQQVAERANVGIRSVFRHFSDMESLFTAMDESARKDYEPLFIGGDRDGTLHARIRNAVERHADAYEQLHNLSHSAQIQMWRSPALREGYARNQRGLRKDLESWLPELKNMDPDDREIVDAFASFA